MFADTILRFFGENPEVYSQSNDKWPAAIATVLFYSLPIVFGLIIIAPFIWMWFKKKKLTWRNVGVAILQSVGLVVLGIIALFTFLSFALGQVFQALNSY